MDHYMVHNSSLCYFKDVMKYIRTNYRKPKRPFKYKKHLLSVIYATLYTLGLLVLLTGIIIIPLMKGGWIANTIAITSIIGIISFLTNIIYNET